MRIIFFGSSHGVPEPNRRASSALIEVDENRYFIDMGTQSIEELITRRMPVESVKGIFITHMHGDHSDGLISFLDLCTWYYQNADPAVFLPEPYEDSIAAMGAWLKCTGITMRPFRFSPVKEGLLYRDEAITVHAFRTQHTDFSYAYLVEAQGKRVLFSGDLSHMGPQADFPVSVLEKPLDLAICESAHFPATAYLPVFEGQPNLKQLCFNHYSDLHLASVLAMTEALPGVKVFRAMDGTEIQL